VAIIHYSEIAYLKRHVINFPEHRPQFSRALVTQVTAKKSCCAAGSPSSSMEAPAAASNGGQAAAFLPIDSSQHSTRACPVR